MACHKLTSFLNRAYQAVSVEPTLLFYSFAYFLFFPTVQDLLFTKICYEKFKDFNFCAYNKSAKDDSSLQDSMSHWQLYLTVAFLTPSAVMTLCAGSWSDRFGRKRPLLIPIGGFIISLTGFLVYSYYIIKWPLQVFIALSVLNGIFGGELAVLTLSISYISNVSEPENRIFRLSILESMLIIGATLGAFFSGLLTSHFGHSSAFIAAICAVIICFVYTSFFVKNHRAQNRSTEPLFSFKNITEGFQCCFKQRPPNKRMYILLSLLVISLSFSIIGIEQAITYLFVKDDPLSWNFDQFTTMNSVAQACGGFVLIFILPTFRSYLKLSDPAIGIIGGVSSIIKLVVLGLSTNTALVYISVILGSFNSLQIVAARSILSKNVESHEEGKIFSIASILQYISIFIMTLIGTTLWPIVRLVFKGLLFEASSSLLITSTCLLLLIYTNMKKNRQISEQNLIDNEPEAA